ncbi:MmcQ/YjbR family DNA-binding protein [Nocardia aurantia]|uniref:Cytoplasmic protein n=1 Tax=Nocardia aurantia TaxID=2585199 RepID=A0A7K0E0L6_9NOCA|nr:MmcQ/YjbR family DNA-binding protein [Nocardia aurantia]MQY30644.1 hypothetical protein [Nocardia aurantia]
MRAQQLLSVAQKTAARLPGAVSEQPFGPDWQVYKVGAKVFMLVTEVRGESMVIVKADPDDAIALRHQFPEITPGYHMNKRHWITVTAGDGISARLVRELVTDSHRHVVSGLPVADRPANSDRRARPGPAQRGGLTGTRLQSTARRIANSLAGVSHGRPFVEKLEVYKTGDKVFLIVTDDPDEQIITVKADPERGQLLRECFPSVTVGRYLDKHHWVSIGAGRGVTPELVTELVHDSYDLVRRGALRRK